MKPQGAHAHEDRLLDFAYEELPPSEARVVEQHVQGCTRCSQTLAGIRGVRTTMARLSPEAAPDAGLDSLLAYAQQSARRSAAGPTPAPRWWRRLLAPALGVAALSVFGVVVVQVNRDVDLSPSFKKDLASKYAPAVPAPQTPSAPATAPAPEAAAKEEQSSEALRAAERAPSPSKKAMSAEAVRRQERSRMLDPSPGGAGGFPEKKADLDSEADESALAGSVGQELAKSKVRKAPGKGAGLQDYAAQEGAPAAYAQKEEPVAKQAPAGDAYADRARDKNALNKDSLNDDAVTSYSSPAQVASAAPPPPPASNSSVSSLTGSASGPSSQGRGMSLPKPAAVAQQPQEPQAMRKSPTSAELLRQADIAYRSGDRVQEVAFLRAVLGTGVQGAQLVDVLSRLCEAEFAAGHQQNGLEVCKRVMQLAPGSSESRMAQRTLARELQTPADEATSKPAAPMKK
jgi:hypothetical protein